MKKNRKKKEEGEKKKKWKKNVCLISVSYLTDQRNCSVKDFVLSAVQSDVTATTCVRISIYEL
jgi:hypothetical protein